MSNKYLTSHFPLISIVLFSLSYALYTQLFLLNVLDELGLYHGMREFFSESGIKLTLLFLLVLVFFMIFSALKLIADTTIELSMLFFSKDVEGIALYKARGGGWIYLCASLAALLLYQQLFITIAILAFASLVYFIFLVYKVSHFLPASGLFGFIFLQMFFWSAFILSVLYACIKLYNSFMASLPF